MASEIPNLGNPTTTEFDVEFRSTDDDAWYDVKLFFDGNSLTVKYVNFSDESSEVFHLEKFETAQEVEEFRQRFRLSSVQLQDQECKKLIRGKAVCASYFFNNDEIKFYDAVVDEVLNGEHAVKNGEVECCCSYVLFWQHGPLKGMKTFANISNICLTPPRIPTDPALTSFLIKSMDRFEVVARNEGAVFQTGRGNINVDEFFMRIRRQRNFRCAIRSMEGRINGRCKKIGQMDNHQSWAPTKNSFV